DHVGTEALEERAEPLVERGVAIAGPEVQPAAVVHAMDRDTLVDLVLLVERPIPEPVLATEDRDLVALAERLRQAERVVLDARPMAGKEVVADEQDPHPPPRTCVIDARIRSIQRASSGVGSSAIASSISARARAASPCLNRIWASAIRGRASGGCAAHAFS